MGTNETELVALYENEGLTIEELVAATGYAETIILSVLLARSRKYREATKSLDLKLSSPSVNIDEDPEHPLAKLISDDDLAEYMDAYKAIARNAGDDNLFIKEKVLKNLINLKTKVTDGLGENNPRKLLKEAGQGNLNINLLNVYLQGASKAKAKTLDKLRTSPMFGGGTLAADKLEELAQQPIDV